MSEKNYGFFGRIIDVRRTRQSIQVMNIEGASDQVCFYTYKHQTNYAKALRCKPTIAIWLIFPNADIMIWVRLPIYKLFLFCSEEWNNKIIIRFSIRFAKVWLPAWFLSEL